MGWLGSTRSGEWRAELSDGWSWIRKRGGQLSMGLQRSKLDRPKLKSSKQANNKIKELEQTVRIDRTGREEIDQRD
jgi:hypothetical protein